MRKVWELDLRDSIKYPGSEPNRPGITALRFSSDGKKIAVAGSPYSSGKNVMSRLIVVHTELPTKDIQRFEIAELALDSDLGGIAPPAIAWSPSGDLILAGNNLVHFPDGKTCRIPGNFGSGLLGPNLVASFALHTAEAPRLDFFNSNCNLIDSWQIGGKLSLGDASAERGFLSAVWNGDLVVLDPTDRKIVQRWPAGQVGYASRFADHGKVLCAGEGGDYADLPEAPPRCMDVESGRKIAEDPNIKGGAPFAAAEHASRIVASDHRGVWNSLFRENDTVLKRRVVWDFRRNVEIVSWNPAIQSYSLLGPKLFKGPFMFAISPDGEYVAEGGNGILRLYRIEP